MSQTIRRLPLMEQKPKDEYIITVLTEGFLEAAFRQSVESEEHGTFRRGLKIPWVFKVRGSPSGIRYSLLLLSIHTRFRLDETAPRSSVSWYILIEDRLRKHPLSILSIMTLQMTTQIPTIYLGNASEG
ncbi:hypothetical protein QCA50_012479 [Cerrena zonata]|uniref:Uncharacterized protein n=1 Tax=Cerrena zonata TaxID=2478898 RepID=A0AAW0FWH1_9APHY